MTPAAFLIAMLLAAAPPGATAGDKAAAPTAGAPRVFVLDGAALVEARRRLAAGDEDIARAVALLRRRADAALRAGPFSVTDKKVVPPSGDKHDYMSQAPYWWPDPIKPDGKPYIRKDGEIHPDRGAFDNATLGKMASAVGTLAAAWHFTGHEPYADHAAGLLRAWFLDEKTRMNPNLNFGQSIPGVTDGRAAGIIDTVCLVDLVDAVGLLAGSRAWTDADQKGLEAWFAKYLAWLQESKIGREEAAARNNHGTWYDAQAAAFALFAGKAEVARKVLAESRRRIDSQIQPDGAQPEELARTKSWDYSLMNLRGWFTLAALGRHAGADLWNYRAADGRSIRKALDYLVPFAKEPARWSHKQIVELKPGRLAPLLRRAAAACGDKQYAALARSLEGDAAGDWREVLLGPTPR